MVRRELEAFIRGMWPYLGRLFFETFNKTMSEWIWIRIRRTKGMRHEAIRDEGIRYQFTSSLNIYTEACCIKERGECELKTPTPTPWYVDISVKEDVTVVRLLRVVSFMQCGFEILPNQISYSYLS